jgi:hypothetical protein
MEGIMKSGVSYIPGTYIWREKQSSVASGCLREAEIFRA